MESVRVIMHVDMDAFFASVEQRDQPQLRGRPVLVGGDGPRGVVAAASYEARVFGCRSAQPMAIAKRLCPHAVVVRPRGAAYREASSSVFAILEQLSPLVQGLSLDEAFVDLTGHVREFAEAAAVARRTKTSVREATGLTCSVGVAPNKFVAKLASDHDKPDGLVLVEPPDVEGFLADLPIGRMWGVGPAGEAKLAALGVKLFADVRRLPIPLLEARLGVWGRRLHELAWGRDDRPVVVDGRAKSISQEQTFPVDLRDPDEVRAVVVRQAGQVSRRLRQQGLRARTVTVKIRDGDFRTRTRSHTLDEATDRTDLVTNAAIELFDRWSSSAFRPVRLIGVGTSHLTEDGEQLQLFTAERDEQRRRLDRITDRIRERLGRDAIRRGVEPARRSPDEDSPQRHGGH
jgi:DNA polymerase-4